MQVESSVQDVQNDQLLYHHSLVKGWSLTQTLSRPFSFFSRSLADVNGVLNRFRQLKEDEKNKRISKASTEEQVVISASASDSEDESNGETKPKVNF